MTELLRTPHMVFTRDARLHVVRVTRTTLPITCAEDYEKILLSLHVVLPESERARYALLAEVREVPMNNDPGFEKLMSRYLDRLFGAFARRAVLVKTAVGMLHVGRTSRETGLRATQVFTNEREAMAYLAKANLGPTNRSA
ncbi:hypothetical protein EON77_17695 [bacterium]|nr:MAG: hypothetical protein EON77_17695 [bacterium]